MLELGRKKNAILDLLFVCLTDVCLPTLVNLCCGVNVGHAERKL